MGLPLMFAHPVRGERPAMLKSGVTFQPGSDEETGAVSPGEFRKP